MVVTTVEGPRSAGCDEATSERRAELCRLVAELRSRTLAVLAHRSPVGPLLDDATRAVARSQLLQIDAIDQRIERASGRGFDELWLSIRAMFALVAGAESADGWHSPASRSGRSIEAEPGPVLTDHDYQRDRAPAVADFERAWLRSCVDRPLEPRRPLRALAFNNGMSAISTVLALLDADRARVVVPTTTYHETRFLLERRSTAADPIWSNSACADALTTAVIASGADTVIVDAQANGPSLDICDWFELLDSLGGLDRRITVVLDTSLLSVRCQAFNRPLADNLVLVAVESLTKLAQLGLDRAAAGMVVTDCGTAQRLDRWREHLGSGPSVSAIRQLPSPHRGAIDGRIGRHEHNAARLALRLVSELSDLDHRRRFDSLSIDDLRVVSPALADHRTHSIACRIGSTGCLVGLTGWPLDRLVAVVDAAMRAAERRQAALALGTSFGFDSTRLAIISPDDSVPFLRIAVGAGSTDDVDEVGDLLLDAIRSTGCNDART